MEISFQLTPDDYHQGFKAHRKRTAFSRWGWRFTYVCFAFILFTAVLLSFFGPDKSFRNLFPLWAILAFLVWVLWYCPYNAARKLVKGSPEAQMLQKVDISENGLITHSELSESKIAWRSIIDWVEVEKVFALFLSPLSFFPVPKRAMTDEQKAEFRNLLRTKVSAVRSSQSS